MKVDLPEILRLSGKQNLRVCVIPRSKRENSYRCNQLYLRTTIQLVTQQLNGFIDGTHDIIRHTDTTTTHLARSGHGGAGELPYVGITKDTCNISDDVIGQDILLIDDLYTKTVNIDEDCIQALLDKGARSVIFTLSAKRCQDSENTLYMKYSENALNILTVRTFPQKGPAWIDKNLRGNEDLSILYHLLETHEYEFMKKRERIESAINQLGNCADGLVAIGDANFPSLRGSVKPADKPFALFYKGDISLLSKDNLNIAVIGVLNPDEKIELTERMVTSEIIKHNATIVSGLALGCDSIAHQTALEKGARTIAILPSTLDSILPKENVELAEKLLKQEDCLLVNITKFPKVEMTW